MMVCLILGHPVYETILFKLQAQAQTKALSKLNTFDISLVVIEVNKKVIGKLYLDI